MRGWKGGRATLQYHLLDDGVAWGLSFSTLELQFLRSEFDTGYFVWGGGDIHIPYVVSY